jgi:hypothetical protein
MYNLRRTGELPGVKIGSRIMYDVADLRRLIDRKKGMDRSTASNRVIPRWPNPRRRANAEALEAQLEWHGGKVLFTAAAYARLCNALRISSSSIDLAADDLVALGRAEFRETGAGWMLVLNFRRTNP